MMEPEGTEITVQISGSTDGKSSFLPRKTSSPIKYVLFTYFDHKMGPNLKCIFPSIIEDELPESFRSYLSEILPFKTLPEKAQSIANQEEEVHGELQQSSTGGAMFMINCPETGTYFGVSQYLQLSDPDSKRGTCQGSLVVLATAPIQGFLLQRVKTMTPALLEQQSLRSVLEAVYYSLSQIGASSINMAMVYQSLPLDSLVRVLGSELLCVVKLLMLEGRVLLFSRDIGRASASCLALAALFPGTLPLCIRQGEAWSQGFDAKAYRWRKFGLPLHIFHTECCLEPVLVMAEMHSIFSKSGFLCGCGNEMIPALPMSNLDCLVDLDYNTVSIGQSKKARACFPPSAADETFYQDMLYVLDQNLSLRENFNMTVWEGSSLWITDKFQEWLELLLQLSARCIEFKDTGERQLSLWKSQTYSQMAWSGLKSLVSSSTTTNLEIALSNYGCSWARKWTRTSNFSNWLNSVPKELCQGTTTIHNNCVSPIPTEGSHIYTYPNGDTYEGNFCGGKRHGYGVLRQSSSGNIYTGEWKFNKRSGQGKLVTGLRDFSYEGNWDNDLPHGQGTCDFVNRERYNGGWLNGRYHGHGKLVFSTGDVYEGDFLEGKKHGLGTFKKQNGEAYVGEWHLDHQHGIGQMTYTDGSIYSGDWRDGACHGEGLLVMPDGLRYEGGWVNGYKHGNGRLCTTAWTKEGFWELGMPKDGDWTIRHSNGDHYAGHCKDFIPHGEGVCKYADGGIYTGAWCDGQRDGLGTWVGPSTDKCYGVWKADKLEVPMVAPSIVSAQPQMVQVMLDESLKHSDQSSHSVLPRKTPHKFKDKAMDLDGFHTYTYPNGDTYTGFFVQGTRHGNGVYVEHHTGNCYDGEWENGLRHGIGKLTSGHGSYVYEGEWQKDKRTGNGKCIISGKETYTGLFKDGIFNGKGTFTDFDGNVYEGEWVDGKKQGMGTQSAASGWKYTGEWHAGQRDGVGTCRYNDGSVYSGQWKNDCRHGEGVLLWENGEKFEGLWQNNQEHGHGRLTTATGTVKEGEWQEGSPSSGGDWQICYEDGANYAGGCQEGIPHGQGVCKYPNGDVYTGQWDKGKRNGHGLCIFSNGEIFNGEWENDHIAVSGTGMLTLTDGTVHKYLK